MHKRPYNDMGSDIVTMAEYFERMAQDNRLIVIYRNGKFNTMITFSICNDYKPFCEKKLFSYLPHDPNGNICYVEEMESKGWSRDVLRQIEIALVSRYPQLEYAVWYRPTNNNDRKVIYKRRFHEASL